MALNQSDPLTHIIITSVVCSSVATLLTIYRIFIRRSRLWTDDGCAIFSTCILLLQVASVFLHADTDSGMKRSTRIAAYYLIAITFYAIIWSARLSILFSIIRIDPSGIRRRFLLGVAVAFLGACLILIAQLFWVCERKPQWRDAVSPQCPLSRQVVILQLLSDVASDTILIVAPLQVLRHLEDKGLRRRLMIIFSTCVVTTIVSLVHSAMILTGGGPKVLVAAVVEDCISLIVCNIPIVVSASLRTCQSDPHRSPTSSSLLRFATYARTDNRTADNIASTTLGDVSVTWGRKGFSRYESHGGEGAFSQYESQRTLNESGPQNPAHERMNE
ncbi:hypothetical protein B0H17DRAFT_362893 [Mycena rosella]|uniref:Rhodopsin domain-containing protein n=1 Tax=Mycena rosella TaxID=1033263 RepID=A0AAD7GZT6_MYCRO|nr:hypothetical protein B0H17DRAFT_362893 [Mycena rosella]